jgi:pimeloyl-ACP methyl ester carboxylesterase
MVEGQGEPVVLIHGLGSSAQMNWGAPGTIKLLSKNNEVIAMDVRGHGGSDTPSQTNAYGIELTEDVVRLLDHLHIEKAHIIGYSMGGMIALKFVARHPERVKSVALGGMGWLRDGSALQEIWGQMPDRHHGQGPGLCARSLGDLALSEAEVRAIEVPVAVFVGDHDPVRQLYVAPLQSARPDWRITVISNAGHLNCIFKTQFRDGLKEWLEKVSPTQLTPPVPAR